MPFPIEFELASQNLIRWLARGITDVQLDGLMREMRAAAATLKPDRVTAMECIEGHGLVAHALLDADRPAEATPWLEAVCAMAIEFDPHSVTTAWSHCEWAEALIAAGLLDEVPDALAQARRIGAGRDGGLVNKIAELDRALRRASAPAVSLATSATPPAPLRVASPVEVNRRPVGSMGFGFNGGARFVIAFNRDVPGMKGVEAFIAARVASRGVHAEVVAERFGRGRPSAVEIEIGSKVDVARARAALLGCREHFSTPFSVALNTDDGEFGYTQRVYLGLIVPTGKRPATAADLDSILAEGISEDEFRARIAALP